MVVWWYGEVVWWSSCCITYRNHKDELLLNLMQLIGESDQKRGQLIVEAKAML